MWLVFYGAFCFVWMFQLLYLDNFIFVHLIHSPPIRAGKPCVMTIVCKRQPRALNAGLLLVRRRWWGRTMILLGRTGQKRIGGVPAIAGERRANADVFGCFRWHGMRKWRRFSGEMPSLREHCKTTCHRIWWFAAARLENVTAYLQKSTAPKHWFYPTYSYQG